MMYRSLKSAGVGRFAECLFQLFDRLRSDGVERVAAEIVDVSRRQEQDAA